MIKKMLLTIILYCFSGVLLSNAFAQDDDGGIGQTIQINTQLESFVGRPTWLIVIRDIDHNTNFPYIYDIRQGINFFLIFTHGRNYKILASTLQFSPYKRFPFSQRKIENFCGLESDGRIMHGESMSISISGKLTPNPDSYSCNVAHYPDYIFTIVRPDE